MVSETAVGLIIFAAFAQSMLRCCYTGACTTLFFLPLFVVLWLLQFLFLPLFRCRWWVVYCTCLCSFISPVTPVFLRSQIPGLLCLLLEKYILIFAFFFFLLLFAAALWGSCSGL